MVINVEEIEITSLEKGKPKGEAPKLLFEDNWEKVSDNK